MDSITRNKINQHLVAAQAMFYRSIASGTFEITPHWVRGLSSIPIPSFNTFMPLDWEGLTDDTLADAAAFYASYNVMYAIELVHDTLPDATDYLNRRRYQALPPQPAMLLTDLPTDLSLNGTTLVERVTTVPSHSAFCTLLHDIFDYTLSDILKLYPVAHLKAENKPYLRHYLAFVDDHPAAAGTLICRHEVATVLNLCTLDRYRRQHVGTTLLHHMLREAVADGFTLAMLYATPQAYQMLTKFGFEMYTQRQWFLPPGLQYEE